MIPRSVATATAGLAVTRAEVMPPSAHRQCGGWRRGRQGSPALAVDGPSRVRRGRRSVAVDRPYAVSGAAVPVGDGPGRRVGRRVGMTPWGWHKIVMSKTCLVP
jgi:hypothetical protein